MNPWERPSYGICSMFKEGAYGTFPITLVDHVAQQDAAQSGKRSAVPGTIAKYREQHCEDHIFPQENT